MKKIVKHLAFLFLLVALFASCEKEENKVYYEGGTPPVLSTSITSPDLPLSYTNRDKEALKLSWTNPDYKFNTGVSAHDVNYKIEIDTAGANFTNPKRQTIIANKELSKSFTQGQFNDYLLNQLQLDTSVTHNIEIRVTSTIGSSVPLHSNVLQYSVIPYAIPPKVDPPASDSLYITGSASPASWMAAGDAELLSQKFTRVTHTLYVLNSITLTGGGSYLFVPIYGDWGAKYGYTGANNQNNVNGDDFKANGGDMLAPPVTGNYKIEADFQRGKFTVTKL